MVCQWSRTGGQSRASHRARQYGHQLTVAELSLMTDPRDPSRRDFLAASAISLIGLARGSESPALRDESQTDGDLLYVGTYTEGTRSEGIYLLRMDRRSGQLQRVGSVDAGANPSFLAIHPNGRVLYAVNELEKYKERPIGTVSAFAIARDTGALTGL